MSDPLDFYDLIFGKTDWAIRQLGERVSVLERRLSIISASKADRDIYGIDADMISREARRLYWLQKAYDTLIEDGPNTATVKGYLKEALR